MLRLHLEWEAARHPANAKPTPADIPLEWKPNVSVEQYKANLRRIVDIGQARGAEVWLLTAPHAFETDENAGKYDQFPNTMAARSLMAFSGIHTYERFLEIHTAYNDAVREVGAELGVPVVDMEKVYHEHRSEPLFSSTDVPHPTQEGHDLEAETLYAELVARGMLPASSKP
jgi:lysophospholipase L1-like esterase